MKHMLWRECTNLIGQEENRNRNKGGLQKLLSGKSQKKILKKMGHKGLKLAFFGQK